MVNVIMKRAAGPFLKKRVSGVLGKMAYFLGNRRVEDRLRRYSDTF
jgi:hypothetical protein